MSGADVKRMAWSRRAAAPTSAPRRSCRPHARQAAQSWPDHRFADFIGCYPWLPHRTGCLKARTDAMMSSLAYTLLLPRRPASHAPAWPSGSLTGSAARCLRNGGARLLRRGGSVPRRASGRPGGPRATRPSTPRQNPARRDVERLARSRRRCAAGAEDRAPPRTGRNVSTGFQRLRQVIDGTLRIGEMLEDIHRRDHVERVGWKPVGLQIDDLGLQATLIEPPARELGAAN